MALRNLVLGTGTPAIGFCFARVDGEHAAALTGAAVRWTQRPPIRRVREDEEVHIRLVSFVEGVGVAAFSNCIEYTLEMRGAAISVRADWRSDLENAFEKCSRLVTIRKSEVVDLVGVAAISNCTRCRLEIAATEKRQPARQTILRAAKSSFFRLHGAIFGVRVPKREGILRVGIGAVPVEAGPAAWVRRPRDICVF